MSRAFCLVLAEMTAGGFATLIFVPPHVLGPSFFRFAGLLYAASLAGALYLLHRAAPGVMPTGAAYALAIPVATYTVLAWTRWRGIGYLCVWASLPAAALFVARLASAGAESAVGGEAATVASYGASALFTGSAMTAMLFGHWYLTTPDLPVRYLQRLNFVVIGGLVLVIARAMVTAGLLRSGVGDAAVLSAPVLGGVVVLARVLFGLVATALCIGLTWYCLREESTQAATGFLYLVVCFSLMGEFISHMLAPQLRLPL
ncbi:hypothetical protein HN371_12210 [Candidatus Poribacteria bacterium]|jgi:hypothetical protein|nr:hypothetical protein [Candidatus Poribacteria bacterium]MBT5712344.1 hypothetical protein [Candidatus Poribacteria bacterium]MBT7096265.1 hypothetical protein [Candidatus Poribacteria bacterium]MBT7806041.1 hypothetical protein [Candidatus Poribacteria bacterium]